VNTALIGSSHDFTTMAKGKKYYAGTVLLLLTIGAASCQSSVNAWPKIKIPSPKGYSTESKSNTHSTDSPSPNPTPLVDSENNPFNQPLIPPLAPQHRPTTNHHEQTPNPSDSHQPPTPYNTEEPPDSDIQEQNPAQQKGFCRAGETIFSCILRGFFN
jgi:hypothetical protein